MLIKLRLVRFMSEFINIGRAGRVGPGLDVCLLWLICDGLLDFVIE